MRLETIVTKGVFPLTITGVAAAFSWFFGPHLTNGWQDRQHEFAARSALVTQLTDASAQLMSAVQVREYHRNLEPRMPYLAAYRNWDAQNQIIDAKIDSYYEAEDAVVLVHRWRAFANAMRLYYDLADQDGVPEKKAEKWPTPRMQTLRYLKVYFGSIPATAPRSVWEREIPIALWTRPPHVDKAVTYQHGWRMLRIELIRRRDTIVRLLLTKKMVI